jgi:hypothetical protein
VKNETTDELAAQVLKLASRLTRMGTRLWGPTLERVALSAYGIPVLWHPASARANSYIGDTDETLRQRVLAYIKQPWDHYSTQTPADHQSDNPYSKSCFSAPEKLLRRTTIASASETLVGGTRPDSSSYYRCGTADYRAARNRRYQRAPSKQ